MQSPTRPITGSRPALLDRVAIVTGAARGQGAAHARRFVSEGASVVIADTRVDQGEVLATALGPAAMFVRLDVTDEDDWAAAVAAAEEAFGPVSVLVNNAGIVRHAALVEEDRSHWDDVLATNLTGAWLGIRAVVPSMRRAGGGSIVNVASTAATMGFSGVGAYAASKWGVRGLTRCAALELAADRIRVNAVLPGVVDTPMLRFDPHARDRFGDQPIPRAARPEEITAAVLHLASDAASFMTGAEMLVDGGQTLGTIPPSARRA